MLLSPRTSRSFMLAKLLPKHSFNNEDGYLLSRCKQGSGISSHCLRKKSPRSLLATQIFSSWSRMNSRSESDMHLLKALST